MHTAEQVARATAVGLLTRLKALDRAEGAARQQVEADEGFSRLLLEEPQRRGDLRLAEARSPPLTVPPARLGRLVDRTAEADMPLWVARFSPQWPRGNGPVQCPRGNGSQGFEGWGKGALAARAPNPEHPT